MEKKRRNRMKPISREYLLMFNAITDAEETLRQLREKLMFVQRQAEELYLEDEEEDQRSARRIS
jgi:hypothetical protein